jgi:hypothetical protein
MCHQQEPLTRDLRDQREVDRSQELEAALIRVRRAIPSSAVVSTSDRSHPGQSCRPSVVSGVRWIVGSRDYFSALLFSSLSSIQGMCIHCLVSVRPDRQRTCLEVGSYIANFHHCQRCQRRTEVVNLGREEREEEDEEDGDYEQTITFTRQRLPFPTRPPTLPSQSPRPSRPLTRRCPRPPPLLPLLCRRLQWLWT